jgi:hypothetical protein
VFEIMHCREFEMRSLLRSIPIVAVVLGAALAAPASAQSQQDLKERCNQLLSFYDRYGASRSENSDGARNMTRIGAGIDCEKGRYQEAIAAMEGLLKQKHFDVPPPPTGLAQTPAPQAPSSTGTKPGQ